MKYFSLLLLRCLFLLSAQAQDSRAILFDKDWQFKKDSTLQAESPLYNDADWRKISLPHDWSIEDLPNQREDSVQGPFTKAAVAKGATGYTEGGVGWYRKTFTPGRSYAGKQTYITFDGVYMNSDVWINGYHLGNRPNGYISFSYNLTHYLNPAGKPNVIAVRIKNLGENTRWYTGSGIYRHVWLTVVNEVHTEIWGSYITTTNTSSGSAQVKVANTIRNASSQFKSVNVRIDLLNYSGQIVASKTQPLSVAAGSTQSLTQQLEVTKPSLWTVEKPTLYKARVVLLSDGKMIDQSTTAFGIRNIQFDGQKGFLLNGKVVKIKGGCIHHDHGPLGAASVDRAEERKIELMKKAGYNAVRLSHNPFAPALLDACDRLGMLVVTDSYDMWERQKGLVKEGYQQYFRDWWQKDLNDLILRDRNHPSIIMWGIGNEITEAADSSGYRIVKQLSEEVHRLDPTRPVTEAIVFNPLFDTQKWTDYEPHLKLLDVEGYNYTVNTKITIHKDDDAATRFETEHSKHPQKTYIATEYYPTAALENWTVTEKYPFVLGGFSWTAMDYIGEANLGGPYLVADSINSNELLKVMFGSMIKPWPVFASTCGDLDLIGNRKAASYYQNVVWRNSPVEMLVQRPLRAGIQEIQSPWGFPDELKSWTWPGEEGKKMKVHVYTRSKVVKLELNGKTIAEQIVPDSSITATFKVAYQPGILIARGFDNEVETGADTLSTAGKPVAIRLIADRKIIKAGASDLSYVSVEVIDEKGKVVPSIDDLTITYQLTGDATLAGLGNGNPADMSGFQQNHKKVFQGRGLAIVKPGESKGTITLKASANGLKVGFVQIRMN